MKFKGSRIIALLLSFMMIATTFAFADAETAQKATVNYKDFLGESAQQFECYYDDSFWAGKSTSYDTNLATLSMAMILSAGNTVDTNAVAALTAIGCTNVTSKGYGNKTANAAASVMGTKQLANGTKVIAVVVRGSRNVIEWVKNVEMGKSGDASGYSGAAKTVYNNAVSYIKKNAGSKYKVWIMGHSRGGAIANLAGKKLSDKYGKAKVYGYCFENPVVAGKNKKDAKYTNIHNFRNSDSGVTTVMPAYMNSFDLVGKWDKTVSAYGGKDATVKQMLAKITTNAGKYQSANGFKWSALDLSKAISNINKITSGDIKLEYLVSDVGTAVPQKNFWKVVQKRLKLIASTRKAYTTTKSSKSKAAAKKLGCKANEAYTPEKAMQCVVKLIMMPEQFEGVTIDLGTLTSSMTKLMNDKTVSKLLNDILSGKITDNTVKALIGTDAKYAATVKKLWDASSLESSISSKALKKQLKLTLATMTEPLIKMLAADFDGNTLDEVFITIVCSGEKLIQAHYPEVTMAYVMAEGQA